MSLSGIHLNKKGVFLLFCLICILLLYKFSNTFKDKNNSGNINLGKLLEVAIKAAENGGVEVVKIRDNLKIKSKGLTKEGAQDPVTTADFLSHCSMLRTLKYFFPHLEIISEEAKVECDDNDVSDYNLENVVVRNLPEEVVNESDIVIWVDPLDATQEYTEKLYAYVTTMVCVAVKDVPVIGVIHNPFTKITSWAWVGQGKSSDLIIQKPISGEKLKILISRSHSGQIKSVLKNFLKDFDLIEAGGSGYKSLQVAKGKADAYLHITAIKKWDICAGNAILKSIGGQMTTKFNTTIDYTNTNSVRNENGLIATYFSNIHNIFIGKL